MPVKLKNFTIFLKNLTKNKKNLWLICMLGIIGIVLIGFSDTFSKENSNSNDTISELNCEKYISFLEKRTKEMLSSVEGAGRCKVMITADVSCENEFAVNESVSQEKNQNNFDIQNQSEIVFVENGGQKQALVRKVYEPKIRGVLVLCEGADNPKIKEMITFAVQTVLGVSSNKVSVTKLK